MTPFSKIVIAFIVDDLMTSHTVARHPITSPLDDSGIRIRESSRGLGEIRAAVQIVRPQASSFRSDLKQKEARLPCWHPRGRMDSFMNRPQSP